MPHDETLFGKHIQPSTKDEGMEIGRVYIKLMDALDGEDNDTAASALPLLLASFLSNLEEAEHEAFLAMQLRLARDYMRQAKEASHED